MLVPEKDFYPEADAAPPAGGEEYAPTIVPTVDPYLDAGAGAAPPPPAHLFGAPPAGGEEYVPTIVPPEDLEYPYPGAGGGAHLPPAYCAGCARGCCTYYFA